MFLEGGRVGGHHVLVRGVFDEVVLLLFLESRTLLGVDVTVVATDSLGYLSVQFTVVVVQDDVDQVEAGEEGVRQVNVPASRERRVVLSILGIGSSHYTAPGIETGMNACLGNGHCLLFHDFVDGHSVHLGHLVELVDADYSSVCQHHGSCF